MKLKLNIGIILTLLILLLEGRAQKVQTDSMACFRKPVAEFLLKQNEKAKTYEKVIGDKEEQNRSLLTALQAEQAKIQTYKQDSIKYIQNEQLTKTEANIYKDAYQDEQKSHKKTKTKLKLTVGGALLFDILLLLVLL